MHGLRFVPFAVCAPPKGFHGHSESAEVASPHLFFKQFSIPTYFSNLKYLEYSSKDKTPREHLQGVLEVSCPRGVPKIREVWEGLDGLHQHQLHYQEHST
jgi:hypothetical protein